MTYWQANNFYYDFQDSIAFWRWGGQDIKIFGQGTLNGNGQIWYNEFAGMEILVRPSSKYLFFCSMRKILMLYFAQDSNNTFYRPILFVAENATRISIEGITQLNSPCWNNFFVGSKDVSFDNVYIHAFSTNASVSYHMMLQ